ncbi:MAG: hypothetical protein COA78_29020 [Blastopirellula sp.]|nr:MAG: hypothetical protein COA78_29020 [Blastopirellula sp.]
MSHFTCKCCQQEFDKQLDPCFIVRITAFLDVEPAVDQQEMQDPDRDNLGVLSEALETLHRMDDPTLCEDRLDEDYRLCRDCYEKYSADPIPRETAMAIRFSEN